MKKRMRNTKNQSLVWLVMALLISFLSIGWSGCLKPSNPALEGMEQVTVRRVVDGDTFITEDNRRVRLIGIDAPESVKPDTPPEPFGVEASTYLEDLIEGEVVYMERDISETDPYNRLLRYIYLEDGTFVNELLLEEGYATHVVFKPDVAYREVFKQAEDRAKWEKRGLWASP